VTLGPEVVEMLGHANETMTSFAASKVAESQANKIKKNMIKEETEAANKVIELLKENK